jgi:hypothetical protein
MPRPDVMFAVAAMALLAAPGAAAAQQGRPQADVAVARPSDPAATDAAGADVRLVFEREVFSYRGRGRRDPFQPLTQAQTGALFSELKLQMILFSEDPNQSVVAISDATGKQYRLRRGDSVGNATVVDIAPSRVVFSVVDFGIRRQEIVNLKPNREGA